MTTILRIKVLGYFYVAVCGLGLFVGLALLATLRTDPGSRAPQMIGPLAALLAIVYFIPGFIGGIGLIRRKAWARIVIIVLSVLLVPIVPVGTPVGIWGLWVLLGKQAQAVFGASAKEAHPSPFSFTPGPQQAPSSRYLGLLLAMAGVGATFIVVIGTGFRLSGDPTPPVIAGSYFPAIGVLLTVVGVTIAQIRTGRSPMGRAPGRSRWFGLERLRNAGSGRSGEEAQRHRLMDLAADPVRQKYVERIERGESWSADQIAYAEDLNCTATCIHLQPIERAMRGAGIHVRLLYPLRVQGEVTVNHGELHRHFVLPRTVHYVEPSSSNGRSHEDPPGAVIVCDECESIIDVVHALVATPQTPRFPEPTNGPA